MAHYPGSGLDLVRGDRPVFEARARPLDGDVVKIDPPFDSRP